MISQLLLDEVRQRAARGISQRRLARLMGIDRRTVRRIIRMPQPERPARLADPPEFFDLGPVGRCPGCGGRVILPCRLCEVRMQMEQRQRAPGQPGRTARPALRIKARKNPQRRSA